MTTPRCWVCLGVGCFVYWVLLMIPFGGVVKTAWMERHETLCGPTSVKLLLFKVLKNGIFKIKKFPHSDYNTVRGVFGCWLYYYWVLLMMFFFFGGGCKDSFNGETWNTVWPTSVKILLFTVLKNRIFRIKICPHSDHNTDL